MPFSVFPAPARILIDKRKVKKDPFLTENIYPLNKLLGIIIKQTKQYYLSCQLIVLIEKQKFIY